MKVLMYPVSFYLLFSVFTSCGGQSQSGENFPGKTNLDVGGPFENREFTYYGIPKTLFAVDTSSAWRETGQKILITGTMYQVDGKTPASDVLLYYYHTNAEGKYIHKPGYKRSIPPNNQGQTHGYIRGWVKTDASGQYSIYTVRPGAYPTWDTPAHIHVTIKEPNDIPEYYIDDFVFEDDTLVNAKYKQNMENRGGNGIVKLKELGDYQVCNRTIILGMNIPNYPKQE